MTEAAKNRPAGVARALVVRGTQMSEITVRPTAASFASYIEARIGDATFPESLSFEQVVELTFEYHAEWQSSPERKAEREGAKAAREEAAKAAKAKRDAERVERAKAEKAALEAKLQKLTGSPEK